MQKNSLRRNTGRQYEFLPIIAFVSLATGCGLMSMGEICIWLYHVPLEKASLSRRAVSALLGMGCGMIEAIIVIAIIVLICLFCIGISYLLEKLKGRKKEEEH